MFNTSQNRVGPAHLARPVLAKNSINQRFPSPLTRAAPRVRTPTRGVMLPQPPRGQDGAAALGTLEFAANSPPRGQDGAVRTARPVHRVARTLAQPSGR